MSSWVVTDDTPTATVVWMAAEQIGKAQNHEQLQKICDYLVNKHWFQTAGDLRSARQEATEWQALEVPGRLKLAIQQVLDQSTVSNYSYDDYYAADETTTQDWTETSTGYEYGSAEGADQAPANYYYSSDYGYPSSDTTNSTTAQYSYDQTDYKLTIDNPPSYEESSRASHENYYSNTSTNSNYDSGEAATTLLSLHGSMEQAQIDESDVVEAHAIEEEVAKECEEVLLASDQPSYAVELGEPTQRDESKTSGTWSCGQCTYLNPMTSSFCEMCIGHLSLSPDMKPTAGTSVSASLLTPAKPMVDVVTSSPPLEPPVAQYTQSGVTCMMPPVGSLYPPSAPDFEGSEDEPVDPSPIPPPPPYPGKSCQMRREEATTEYTF